MRRDPVDEKLRATSPANDVARCVGDSRIQRALDALHACPKESWTVAKLAKVAGLSRAAFARRFVAEVGVPPLRHLASIRVQRAADLFVDSSSEGNVSLAFVADAVGYASEFALSRAFRRVMGESPTSYRTRIRKTAPSATRCVAA